MAVYFIRSGNFIKIGYADDPHRRLKQLQTGNPQRLELIGHIDGDMSTEAHIHGLFSDFRVKGEWFELTTDIMAYVESRRYKVTFVERVKSAVRRKKEQSRRTTSSDKWIEFKPGTIRSDGSRTYYPKYRMRNADGSKAWVGKVPDLSPMTKPEMLQWKKENTPK